MKVYILQGQSGDYEDHSTWILGVFASKEDAKARKARCEKALEKKSELIEAYNEFARDILEWDESDSRWPREEKMRKRAESFGAKADPQMKGSLATDFDWWIETQEVL